MVQQLKLYRFATTLGNAVYVVALFIYSHRARCYRLGLDLLEYVYDPILMNDLVRLQAITKHDVAYKPFLTGHKRLEPLPAEEYVCGIALRNAGSSIGRGAARAVALVKAAAEKEEYEIAEVEPRTDWSRKVTEPERTARGFPEKLDADEFKLLEAYIERDEFLTKLGKDTIKGGSRTDLLVEIAKKTPGRFVKIDDLAEDWVAELIRAIMEERPIEKFKLTIPTDKILPKTSKHITDAITTLSHAVTVNIRRRDNASIRPQVSVSATPVSEAFSRAVTASSGTVGEVSHGPDQPAQSIVIPRFDAKRLNHRGSSTEPKRCRESQLAGPAVSVPAKPEAVAVPGNQTKLHARKPCPACGLHRHPGQGKSSCDFVSWMEIHKKLPAGHPDKIIRRHGESEYDSFRRAYVGKVAK